MFLTKFKHVSKYTKVDTNLNDLFKQWNTNADFLFWYKN